MLHTIALFAVGFLVLGPVVAALVEPGPSRKKRDWDKLVLRRNRESIQFLKDNPKL